ncbi:MAG: hypothetical protein QOK16_1024 [Solirubrobacteraceae bacterium]|nr:hypothetical protein [Solirubrobacteraceae bacterium]MEA2186013.1 hypothetical protein [Solirubrobacteraceae bacterium]
MTPGEHEIQRKILDTAVGRMEGTFDVLAIEHRHRVRPVERDPTAMVTIHDVAKRHELEQVTSARRDKQHRRVWAIILTAAEPHYLAEVSEPGACR